MKKRRMFIGAAGVAAVLAPMLAAGVGIASAEGPAYHRVDDRIVYDVVSKNVQTPGPCAWADHWQDGMCVTIESPSVPGAGRMGLGPDGKQDFGMIRFACPAEFPYPYEGIFSGNPWWNDHSHNGYASVKAVKVDGRQAQDLSYAGTGTKDPGYVTVARDLMPASDTYYQGTYACADRAANPR